MKRSAFKSDACHISACFGSSPDGGRVSFKQTRLSRVDLLMRKLPVAWWLSQVFSVQFWTDSSSCYSNQQGLTWPWLCWIKYAHPFFYEFKITSAINYVLYPKTLYRSLSLVAIFMESGFVACPHFTDLFLSMSFLYCTPLLALSLYGVVAELVCIFYQRQAQRSNNNEFDASIRFFLVNVTI